jgi:hypothetical protein
LALPDGKVDVILSAIPAEDVQTGEALLPLVDQIPKNDRTCPGIAEDQKT